MYEDLKQALYTDSAIAGEAAGYSMGLVMLGSGSAEIIDEMLQYAHETQHEKIIRGLAIGIAFICYGKQEQADSTIERLLAEKVRTRFVDFIGIHLIRLFYSGSHPPLWWNIYSCFGIRWHFGQWCCSEIAPHCCFRYFRRCPASRRHFPRVPPFQEP